MATKKVVATENATVVENTSANTMAAALVAAVKEAKETGKVVDEAVMAPAAEATEPEVKDVVFAEVAAEEKASTPMWKKALKWTGIGLAVVATVGVAAKAISSLCSSSEEEESIEAESQEALANA